MILSLCLEMWGKCTEVLVLSILLCSKAHLPAFRQPFLVPKKGQTGLWVMLLAKCKNMTDNKHKVETTDYKPNMQIPNTVTQTKKNNKQSNKIQNLDTFDTQANCEQLPKIPNVS